jgi:hypothetical protein
VQDVIILQGYSAMARPSRSLATYRGDIKAMNVSANNYKLKDGQSSPKHLLASSARSQFHLPLDHLSRVQVLNFLVRTWAYYFLDLLVCSNTIKTDDNRLIV